MFRTMESTAEAKFFQNRSNELRTICEILENFFQTSWNKGNKWYKIYDDIDIDTTYFTQRINFPSTFACSAASSCKIKPLSVFFFFVSTLACTSHWYLSPFQQFLLWSGSRINWWECKRDSKWRWSVIRRLSRNRSTIGREKIIRL